MEIIVAFIGGMIIMALIVVVMMPKMMIVTHASRYDFDTTVGKIEERITRAGWSHKGTSMFHKDIKEATGNDLGAKIAGIKLCKGDYACTILKDERARFVSCLMPCSIAVWESDVGQVYISEMNIPLMGKLFGGTISKIMAGKVGPEEKTMLESVIKN